MLIGKELVALGILNLAIAAIIFVLVKEKLIFSRNKAHAEFITQLWLRNVVVIAFVIILIGLFNNR